jgi:hypothetical protein
MVLQDKSPGDSEMSFLLAGLAGVIYCGIGAIPVGICQVEAARAAAGVAVLPIIFFIILFPIILLSGLKKGIVLMIGILSGFFLAGGLSFAFFFFLVSFISKIVFSVLSQVI